MFRNIDSGKKLKYCLETWIRSILSKKSNGFMLLKKKVKIHYTMRNYIFGPALKYTKNGPS